MQYLGRLDWSLGPGPRIYSTAQAQHAGTGPLDVELRRFEFTAMGMLGKSDRQCRLLVQATNLHCAILARQQQKRPICDTSSRGWKVRSHLSPHRAASHRIATHRTAWHHTSTSGK